MRRQATIAPLVLLGLWLASCASVRADDASKPSSALATAAADRSPVDVVLTSDGRWLLSVNQGSGSVSIVRLSDGMVTSEVACGKRPSAIALLSDNRHVLVSSTYSGELTLLTFDEAGALRVENTIELGFEPRGIAVSPDDRTAYVALSAANEVAVVDLASRRVVERIGVGRWPRTLALSSDGTRLAVGASGDGGISVVDTQQRKRLYDTKFLGLNIGQLHVSRDGAYAYFPWMVYADRPITKGNIREGWVLGNRLGRVRLDGQARREAVAIDPRGRAVADPHGLALDPQERVMVVSASGTHELVVFRLEDLPLRPDGPGDHMQPAIAGDADRFYRIPLGGRPMGLRFDASGQRVYVANYLDNSVQEVNIADRKVERTFALGQKAEPSLARRGEAIFYDAQRSTDGWYSCHSCHYEGDTNAVTMDTKNDGSNGTYKMVLSLRNVGETGPWFWHGWQKDLQDAVRKSMLDTMQGPEPSDSEVSELTAFLHTLGPTPNSRRTVAGGLSEPAQRGQHVFASAKAGCAACHTGPYLTDGEIHDVGLGSEYDAYEGYNTPSLVGIANRAGYLHHGRAKSLEDLLSNMHSPAKVSGTAELEPAELADLVEYLRSL